MNKELMLKNVERKMSRIEKAVETLEAIPGEVVEMATKGFCSDSGCVFLTYPYDLELYRDIRRKLDGWKAYSVGNTDDGERFTDLKNNGHKLVVYLDPSKQGTKCSLVKTGEKVVPVYRAKCK